MPNPDSPLHEHAVLQEYMHDSVSSAGDAGVSVVIAIAQREPELFKSVMLSSLRVGITNLRAAQS
jgi:hypothetical protein